MGSSTQEEGSHGGSKAKAVGLYVSSAHHHGVVDAHACCDGATRRVDEKFDVFGGILRVEEEELTDDGIGGEVIDLKQKICDDQVLMVELSRRNEIIESEDTPLRQERRYAVLKVIQKDLQPCLEF